MGGTAVEQIRFIVPKTVSVLGIFLCKRECLRISFAGAAREDCESIRRINMRTISIADMTIRESTMSFKEKLEIAKQMDKLGVDVIELPEIKDDKTDTLLVRTIAGLVKDSVISCVAGKTTESIDKAWKAVSVSSRPRLQIVLPTSAVQMEYDCKKKPKQMLELIDMLVRHAASLCREIEFAAVDATRSEKEFLAAAVKTAVGAGATIISLCDTAGVMMPDEFKGFLDEVKNAVPELAGAALSVDCRDELRMANANVFAAAAAGVSQIKTTVMGIGTPSLEAVVHAIDMKGEAYGLCCNVKTMELQRAVKQMSWFAGGKKQGNTPFDKDTGASREDELKLTENTGITELIKAVKQLGYELSEDDNAKVYEAFKRVAKKKEVNTKDLEAIIATSALQVTPTYKVVDYVINSGNIITPTAVITLEKNGTALKGISAGDGPIEAALLAIEQIIGHHYELDDFQIQSVTEGSEAVGNALIKLRANGMLFSGSGVSTDIIGASIRAYVSALNKIVYEEDAR